mgnify:CR=1 FL=1|jgi:hypothetical protein
MMSIYPQAKEAWFDYFNNGFQHISKGTFMQDFIAFFKKQDSDSHFECFKKFYEENFPHFTIIQKLKYHKTLTETEFNEFFESTSSKIQKDFIDFCYSSIEEHHFGPESLWIIPEDQYEQPKSQHTNNNIIDLTNDEMPALIDDDEMPALESEHPIVNVWDSIYQSSYNTIQIKPVNTSKKILDAIKAELYVDDEMPPLEDIDAELYVEDSDSSD